jgi:hypothetical protein
MNILKKSFRLLSVMLVFSVAALVISCSDEDTLNSADQQTVSSEASSDSYFEDAEGIASSAAFATNAELEGGRTSSLDSRLTGATITFAEGSTEEGGTITIDFGTGKTFNGVVRAGKIIIEYTGARRTQGSSHTIYFENFYVNGVRIEGVRTVTVSQVDPNFITHHIELIDGKITWNEGMANETSATRTSTHDRKWIHNGTPLIPTEDEIRILKDGIAGGTNRNGTDYEMQITADIVFRAECLSQKRFLPVAGEKVLLVGGNTGKEITVNYGTGECDNVISVTINGQTKVVTVSRG